MMPMNATHSVDLYQAIELNLGLAMQSPLVAAVSGLTASCWCRARGPENVENWPVDADSRRVNRRRISTPLI